ncbi:MAG: hypothetical protein LUC88_10300 [Prevotella sp.]|nr:hypothetical protein [Prevotella sp.]
MDKNFQDRIDEFLLHGDKWPEEEKARFLKEVEEDPEKKEQYELTKNVKVAITSRAEKMKALSAFRRQYDEEHRVAGLRPMAGVIPEKEGQEKQSMMGQARAAHSRGRRWLWITGVAAVLVVGFFVIGSYFTMSTSQESSPGEIRGDEGIFNSSVPLTAPDTIEGDTIYEETDIQEELP